MTIHKLIQLFICDSTQTYYWSPKFAVTQQANEIQETKKMCSKVSYAKERMMSKFQDE